MIERELGGGNIASPLDFDRSGAEQLGWRDGIVCCQLRRILSTDAAGLLPRWVGEIRYKRVRMD